MEETTTKPNAKPLNWRIIVAILAIMVLLLIYSNYSKNQASGAEYPSILARLGAFLSGKGSTSKNLEIAKKEIENIINTDLLSDGVSATVEEITDEHGLYKMTVDINKQKIELYCTKDKQVFFEYGMKVDEVKQQKANAVAEKKRIIEEQKTNMPKSVKPQVELFVMSHCTHGLQMEKGILPVAKLLGDKINFQVKFCDYVMHGDEEINEQLRQVCVMETAPAKYLNYLECFVGSGNSEQCLQSNDINKASVASCVVRTDKNFSITANAKKQSTWKGERYPTFNVYQKDVKKYDVNGSPTLVINGRNISTDRDSNSLLQMVCAGFKEAPQECEQVLSSVSPSTGFGYNNAGATSSDGSCG